jgi:hypothetical protein
MNKNISNGLLIGGTLFLLGAGPALAAPGLQYDQSEKYPDKEMTVDLFGSASVGQQTINNLSRQRISHDARLGAGAGLNYFVTRHIGFGAEAYSENTSHSFLDNGSASLIGRLPLGQSGFAPYVYGGAGRQFDPIELNYLQAGGGLEYRFTKRVGAFVDARYVFTDGTKNYGLGRAGLRLGF